MAELRLDRMVTSARCVCLCLCLCLCLCVCVCVWQMVKLRLDQMVTFARHIAKGMKYLHSLRPMIIHRGNPPPPFAASPAIPAPSSSH